MNPINFGGQRLKVQVTVDIYDNKLVNIIETKLCLPLHQTWHTCKQAIVRGWKLMIFEARGQGHN